MSARILTVEDDNAIAAFVTTALEREGYTVAWVQTGREALSHIRDDAPDLVLLDLILPGDVDGLQVCREIRLRLLAWRLPLHTLFFWHCGLYDRRLPLDRPDN